MEQFQLTDELIKKIADLILAKKNSNLKKLVNDIPVSYTHLPLPTSDLV